MKVLSNVQQIYAQKIDQSESLSAKKIGTRWKVNTTNKHIPNSSFNIDAETTEIESMLEKFEKRYIILIDERGLPVDEVGDVSINELITEIVLTENKAKSGAPSHSFTKHLRYTRDDDGICVDAWNLEYCYNNDTPPITILPGQCFERYVSHIAFEFRTSTDVANEIEEVIKEYDITLRFG